jgi:hypothetical protein
VGDAEASVTQERRSVCSGPSGSHATASGPGLVTGGGADVRGWCRRSGPGRESASRAPRPGCRCRSLRSQSTCRQAAASSVKVGFSRAMDGTCR